MPKAVGFGYLFLWHDSSVVVVVGAIGLAILTSSPLVAAFFLLLVVSATLLIGVARAVGVVLGVFLPTRDSLATAGQFADYLAYAPLASSFVLIWLGLITGKDVANVVVPLGWAALALNVVQGIGQRSGRELADLLELDAFLEQVPKLDSSGTPRMRDGHHGRDAEVDR